MNIFLIEMTTDINARMEDNYHVEIVSVAKSRSIAKKIVEQFNTHLKTELKDYETRTLRIIKMPLIRQIPEPETTQFKGGEIIEYEVITIEPNLRNTESIVMTHPKCATRSFSNVPAGRFKIGQKIKAQVSEPLETYWHILNGRLVQIARNKIIEDIWPS